MDCPHLIEKKLCKTRIVDFHRGKFSYKRHSTVIFSRGGGFYRFPVGNSTMNKS